MRRIKGPSDDAVDKFVQNMYREIMYNLRNGTYIKTDIISFFRITQREDYYDNLSFAFFVYLGKPSIVDNAQHVADMLLGRPGDYMARIYYDVMADNRGRKWAHRLGRIKKPAKVDIDRVCDYLFDRYADLLKNDPNNSVGLLTDIVYLIEFGGYDDVGKRWLYDKLDDIIGDDHWASNKLSPIGELIDYDKYSDNYITGDMITYRIVAKYIDDAAKDAAVKDDKSE